MGTRVTFALTAAIAFSASGFAYAQSETPAAENPAVAENVAAPA